MKKTGIILSFTMICILFFSAMPHAFALKTSLYTDFVGTEFDENSDIASGTQLKIEIVNEEKTEASGRLFYAFYAENGRLVGIEQGENIAFAEDEKSKFVSYMVKNAYTKVGSLKILLWEGGNSVMPLAANIMAKKAVGADGPSSQYKNFGEQPQDKLAEQMPVPFDINNYEKTLVSEYNFDDLDFTTLKTSADNVFGDFEQGYSTGLWSVVSGNGIDNSPCVKLEMSETVSTSRFQMMYKDENAAPGDWYYISFKVKGENLSNDGSVSAYIDILDDADDNCGSEYGNSVSAEANNGWIECSVLEEVHQDANYVGEKSEFYNICLNAFMKNMPSGSAVYVDDFKLHKVIFEPMDTVLVTPNYKGFIYGDGGICDINLRVNLTDYNGGYDLADFMLLSRITDADGNVFGSAETDSVTKTMEVVFSSKSLEMGNDYYLETVLKSKTTGEAVCKQEWTLRKREESYRPDIYIDEYNRFVKNGEVMLPLIQYAHGGIYEEYVEITEGTSVDAFTVAGAYHTAYRTPRMQRLRNAMSEKNIGGLLEMCGYVYSNLYTGIPKENVKKQSDIRSLLTVMINNFKNDPRIWAYRTFDEQNAVYYGEELRWQNDIMSSLDPNHPTMGITDKVIEARPGIYAKTVDIIGVDPYFCTGKDTQDLSRVGKMVRQMKTLNPNRPIFATIQGFWFEQRGDLRGPTEQEYRNMAWQVLCEGVTLLDSYCYTDAKDKPWDGKTVEEIWAEQMKVYGEIEEFENVLLSVEPASEYEIFGECEWLTSTSKRHGGKSYFIAVNTENNENTLRIKADEAVKAKEYFSGAEITPDDEGYLNFDMEAYGVAILETEQPNYPSPHCELIRFSVSDCIIMDSDKENPVINARGKKEIYCRAYASDYTKAYINGVQMAEGIINIENSDEITVRVESQDGKNFSEKTYIISK